MAANLPNKPDRCYEHLAAAAAAAAGVQLLPLLLLLEEGVLRVVAHNCVYQLGSDSACQMAQQLPFR
jgi:hypothetical protein